LLSFSSFLLGELVGLPEFLGWVFSSFSISPLWILAWQLQLLAGLFVDC
jgi:hypothetical protein